MRNADLIRFVQQMNRARLHFNQGSELAGLSLEEYLTRARIEWHGVELGKPDWSQDSHSIALTLQSSTMNQVRYIAINSYWQALAFTLPPVIGDSGQGWHRLMDTSLQSPNDLVMQNEGVAVEGSKYLVNPRSIVMLHYDNSSASES